MDSDILPYTFAIVSMLGLMFFLWEVVQPGMKDKLTAEDLSTARFFLTVVSLVLAGLIIHCGGHLFSTIFQFDDPI